MLRPREIAEPQVSVFSYVDMHVCTYVYMHICGCVGVWVCGCVGGVHACEHVLSNLTELRLTGNELPEPPTGVARSVTNYCTLQSHLYELVTEREEVGTKSYVEKVETMILNTVDI